VRAFQKAAALKADGLVGVRTMAVLTAAEPRG
jgi:murein L,D-transpeptidase YcbB/YkuD